MYFLSRCQFSMQSWIREIAKAWHYTQEVYDSLKGADMGDELYVEGMDDAFLEWRAQHGQEWARYYGLTVSQPLEDSVVS